MDKVIEQALVEADRLGAKGKEVTLFMLGKVKELTAGESYAANLELLYNNARNSAILAIELTNLYNG